MEPVPNDLERREPHNEDSSVYIKRTSRLGHPRLSRNACCSAGRRQ